MPNAVSDAEPTEEEPVELTGEPQPNTSLEVEDRGSPPPPVRSRRSRFRWLQVAAVIVITAALCSGGMWMLWHAVINETRVGHSLQATLKNWYLSDQLTYMSIARNVQEGRSAYLEPLTATNWSIYPSAYYWLLGLFARATGTNPIFAWNVVGMLSTFGLMMVAGAWGRWATRSIWGWVLAPFPLLVGTLQYWTDHAWKAPYGDHAMLWAPAVVIFNPAAEGPAMGLAGLACLCGVRALSSSQISMKWMSIAGLLLGCCANVHTYPTLMGSMMVSAILLAFHLLGPINRRAVIITLASFGVAAAIVASGVLTAALGLFAVLVIGALAPLVLVPEWRARSWRPLLAFLASAGLAALPIAVRIVLDVLKPDSFLAWRQSIAQDDDLSLPVGQVLLQTAPVLLIASAAIVGLVRRRRDIRSRAWAAGLVGILAGSALMTFNASWGMNQEPYRFYPYAMFLIALAAFPWLLEKWGTFRTAVPRAVIGATLLATVPTTMMFYNDTEQIGLNFSKGERTAFETVGNNLPEGITLVDVCIPRRAFKALTKANVADFNAGLARPAREDALRKVLYEQGHGRLSSGADLAAAGVTSFVTLNYCQGLSTQALTERFGPPVAISRPADAVACGMPADTMFSAYRTDRDRTGTSPSLVSDFDVNDARRFVATPKGSPPINVSHDCAYGFNTD